MEAHKHAALMLLYAQDAAETERPWERWEYQTKNYSEWAPCGSLMEWNADSSYRRKPQPLECWVIANGRIDSLEVSMAKESADLYVAKWGGRVAHMREVME